MENQYGVLFNGRRIIHPGVYDAVDASKTTTVTAGSTNVPIVVGTADAGESGKVMWFSNPTEGRNQLGSGELVDALELMFSPVPEGGGGASLVGVIVANETTQASLVSDGLTLKAKRFGADGNKIQAKLENGTIAGTKKLTVNRWDTEQLEIFDNLGAVLSIQYVGGQAYAGLTVTVVDGEATALEIKVGATSGTAVADVALDLTNPRFATIGDIAAHLNSLSGYDVAYAGYGSSASLESKTLGATADQDIKTASYAILAVKGDAELQVNNASNLVSLEITGALVNFDYKYLDGGSKGNTPASWVPYFEVAKTQFSSILVVLSSSEAIHAEALVHIQQMEQRQQKQMLFTGGEVGETASKTLQRAATLNSSRAVLGYPGIRHPKVGNGKTVMPRYMTAAIVAGRACGVDASEPITFDYFNLVGLEKDLLVGDPEIDQLVAGGVCVLERVQNGGIRLVQGVTTYIGPNNPLFREISVRRGTDQLSNTIRTTLENTFVGQKGLKATASAVYTKCVDILEQAILDGDIVDYRNIVVRFTGGVVYVDYEVAPTEPINFILVTSNFVPESFVSSASADDLQ